MVLSFLSIMAHYTKIVWMALNETVELGTLKTSKIMHASDL